MRFALSRITKGPWNRLTAIRTLRRPRNSKVRKICNSAPIDDRAMIQRPNAARSATGWHWQTCVYDSEWCIRGANVGVSLPRKVLCDTSARCLTACRHCQPVRPAHSEVPRGSDDAGWMASAHRLLQLLRSYMMLTVNRRDMAGGRR